VGGAFGLERREEALHRQVIPDIARAAHPTSHVATGLLRLSAYSPGSLKADWFGAQPALKFSSRFKKNPDIDLEFHGKKWSESATKPPLF
jgi:hypothetical protein